MKIIIDNKIPFIKEAVQRIADEVAYVPGKISLRSSYGMRTHLLSVPAHIATGIYWKVVE